MTVPAAVERRVADLEQEIRRLRALIESQPRDASRVSRSPIRLGRTAPQAAGSPAYPAEPANTYKTIYLDDESTYTPGLITPSTTDLSASEMGLAHFLGGKGVYLEEGKTCLVVEARGGKRYILDPTPSMQWALAQLSADLSAEDSDASITSAVVLNTGEADSSITTAANLFKDVAESGAEALLVRQSAESRWIVVRVEGRLYSADTYTACGGDLSRILRVTWAGSDGPTTYSGAADIPLATGGPDPTWIAIADPDPLYGTLPEMTGGDDVGHISFRCVTDNTGSYGGSIGDKYWEFQFRVDITWVSGDLLVYFPISVGAPPFTETFTTPLGVDIEFTLTQEEAAQREEHHSASSTFWSAQNPTPAEGVVAVETDTGKEKRGDGSTAFNDLPYTTGSSLVETALQPDAIGTTVQAYSANLDTWSGIAPSANVQTFNAAADYAAMRALLDLEAGTDFYSKSAADSQFATAAALTDHLSDADAAHAASAISVLDTGGNFAGDNVETVLAELAGASAGRGNYDWADKDGNLLISNAGVRIRFT